MAHPDVPAWFVAEADRWSAFIRETVTEIQAHNARAMLNDETAMELGGRKALELAELCPEPEALIAFGLHAVMALAAHVEAEDLEFP